MISLRQQVFDLPPAERLDHALFLIDELSGSPAVNTGWMRVKWGLTESEARVLCVLNAASPRVITKEALFTALGCEESVALKIVDVYLCKLRKKVPFKIQTHWGSGHSLPTRLEGAPSVRPPPPSRPKGGSYWTSQDDQDLRTMWANHSEVSAIAEELDRTERGILDRVRTLRLREC